jgi:hypothetical protein
MKCTKTNEDYCFPHKAPIRICQSLMSSKTTIFSLTSFPTTILQFSIKVSPCLPLKNHKSSQSFFPLQEIDFCTQTITLSHVDYETKTLEINCSEFFFGGACILNTSLIPHTRGMDQSLLQQFRLYTIFKYLIDLTTNNNLSHLADGTPSCLLLLLLLNGIFRYLSI